MCVCVCLCACVCLCIYVCVCACLHMRVCVYKQEGIKAEMMQCNKMRTLVACPAPLPPTTNPKLDKLAFVTHPPHMTKHWLTEQAGITTTGDRGQGTGDRGHRYSSYSLSITCVRLNTLLYIKGILILVICFYY